MYVLFFATSWGFFALDVDICAGNVIQRLKTDPNLKGFAGWHCRYLDDCCNQPIKRKFTFLDFCKF